MIMKIYLACLRRWTFSSLLLCPALICCSFRMCTQTLEVAHVSLMHRIRRYASSVALNMSMAGAAPRMGSALWRRESAALGSDSISVGFNMMELTYHVLPCMSPNSITHP